MLFLGLGIILLAMKYLEIGPVAAWSWWVVLSPFALAVAWWTWADWSGYTKKKAVREGKRRASRRASTRAAKPRPGHQEAQAALPLGVTRRCRCLRLQRRERRSFDHGPVGPEPAAVAGAVPARFHAVPVHLAAQVRADRATRRTARRRVRGRRRTSRPRLPRSRCRRRQAGQLSSPAGGSGSPSPADCHDRARSPPGSSSPPLTGEQPSRPAQVRRSRRVGPAAAAAIMRAATVPQIRPSVDETGGHEAAGVVAADVGQAVGAAVVLRRPAMR